MVGRQQVSGGDDQRDRPIDEFQGCQRRQTAVVGQLLRPWNFGLAEQRQVHDEGFAFADLFDRLTLGRCPPSILFRHHLPFGNEGFADEPDGAVTVGRMGRTGRPQADPLISPFASFLRAPMMELYAFLWRVGVLEIVPSEPVPPRRDRRVARVAGAALAAPDRQRRG
jgi:hypothetical protein